MNAMKRIVNLMALAFAAASTVSCISEIAEPVQEMVKDENLELKELVFSASFEGRESDDDTKTALVNGREVYWLPGDQISIKGVEDPFTCTATGPTPVTDFVGKAPEADKYYALYPASLLNNWQSFPDVILKLPHVQRAVKDSFASDLNAAIGVADAADMAFTFKNIFGYVKFEVPDDLKDLTYVLVESVGREQLSGFCRANCNRSEPYARSNSESVPSVQLVSEQPMEAGAYYIAMIPGTYSAGLRFTFKNSSGQQAVKTISKSVTLSAGQIRSIGTMNGLVFEDVPDDPIPPDDEIWYVTSDNSIAVPKTPEAFGATIVSNTYSNGMGIIKFDGPVTVVGEKAFWYCDKQDELTNVYLPESVTMIGMHAFNGCGALESISIPRNVEIIEDYAFSCPWGGGIRSVTNRSEKLKEIGVSSFVSECLCEFKGVFASEDNRSLIKDGELMIFAQAGLQEYSVPAGVTSIGSRAFYDCNKLTRIVLPDGLKKIGDESFYQCNHMTEINIPESVVDVGEDAFTFCVKLKEITLPDNITSIPRCMFNCCWELESVRLGDKVKSIGEYAFSECYLLESIRIPDTIESVSENAFGNCHRLREIDCKYSTADKRALIMNNVLLAFAPYGVKQLVIPSGVTRVGEMACVNCKELESVIIPEGVQQIGMHAFNGCNLSSLRLPSTLKYIENFMFCNNERLAEVYCLATVPPGLLGTWFNAAIFKEGTIIRVPTESVDSYKNASIWNMYPIMDFDEEIYVSSDYSQDGAVKVVQQASVGNGIDIVFMGDAYSDRQIAAGDYEADINKAMEMLFSEEPYKSFRDHFNVYIVKAVSATEGYGLGSTAFSGYFGNGTEVGGDHNKVTTYAQKAISSSRMNEAVVIVMMNREYYAGTCYMYYPSVTNGYGNGLSISYFPLGTDDQMLAGLICHEAGGHGFSKLADEYSYESMGTIASDAVANHKAQQKDWGWWKNVDFTSDLSSIRWSHFLNDSRYQYDGLGAYEGGLTYWSGVWRPTENSIMRHNTGGFNAPSRESIYYRIHKLAYGSSWTYDYEEFARYDAVNRVSSAAAAAERDNYVEKAYEPTPPPVIIPHAWNE